jgi:hypothetical protein|eukprot:SAG25_NODE_1033_length_4221_cov_1.963852_5_plen_113_part_00
MGGVTGARLLNVCADQSMHLPWRRSVNTKRRWGTACPGLFAGVGAYALKMAPKNAAGGMVAAACGLLTVASLNNVGLSSADAKKAGGEDLQAQIIDAAAHIEAQKAAIAARI